MMNFVLKPSLSFRVIVSIVTNLWNKENIRALVTNSDFEIRGLVRHKKKFDDWEILENKVKEDVLKLSLPKSLKIKVINFVAPIGLEILKFKEFHEELFQTSNAGLSEIFKCICWKLQGTIDQKQTAEILIKNNCLHVTKSFELACNYCLEYYIPRLWSKLQQSEYTFVNADFSLDEKNGLVLYWIHDLENKVNQMTDEIRRNWRDCSVHQFAFEYATIFNHKTAAEYFLEKLKPAERTESLVRYTNFVVIRNFDLKNVSRDVLYETSEFTCEVLCFLLSKLNKEQQLEVFQDFSASVLRCLLAWPWHGLILENETRVWRFQEIEFHMFLIDIAEKILFGYKDFRYQELFEIFLKQESATRKNWIRNILGNKCITQYLFDIGDKTIIDLIWKGATIEEKLNFMHNYAGSFLIGDLIYDDKWDLVEYLIRTFLPSNSTIRTQFKEHCERLLSKGWENKVKWRNKDIGKRWNRFFQLLV